MARLRAALVDVGGTLWEGRPPTSVSRTATVERLAAALPGVEWDVVERLRAALEEAVARLSGERVQDADGMVRAAAACLGLRLDPAAVGAVRRAMIRPTAEVASFHEDAGELLGTLHGLGLRTVIVSNTGWHDADAYRRDLVACGLGEVVDAIVTSVDVGRRKPDPAILAAALDLAGCEAAECVMLGDVEEKDVLPALALGMRAVRVAHGATGPVITAAGATARSLREAAAAVRGWCAG
jgi:putative hydrolase of the HAD superfamily